MKKVFSATLAILSIAFLFSSCYTRSMGCHCKANTNKSKGNISSINDNTTSVVKN